MNNFQQIGATLTGIAAIATASVTVYNAMNNSEKKDFSGEISGVISDKDGWTNLRQLPSAESRILTRLANDTKVYIIYQSGDWYYIKTKNNTMGFIHSKNFLQTN